MNDPFKIETPVNLRDVLVVDDCSVIRKRLSRELAQCNFRVETAADGVEALQLARSGRFNYLVTDWEMPNMDGGTLCRCLRSEFTEKYIYVIVMTAHKDLFGIVDGIHSGADDFIEKPINIRELCARMYSGARVLQMEHRLTLAATQDALTGVLNRRALEANRVNRYEDCVRRGQPLSCMMVDIDRFKQFNDTHGHIGGDVALTKVVDAIRAFFRNGDSIYRYGGEEFLMMLPDTDELGAEVCAERCRAAVAELSFDSLENASVTISCGVAEVDPSMQSADALIASADQALLLAKRNGRNCTVRYSQIPKVGSDRDNSLPTGPAEALETRCG